MQRKRSGGHFQNKLLELLVMPTKTCLKKSKKKLALCKLENAQSTYLNTAKFFGTGKLLADSFFVYSFGLGTLSYEN